MNSSRRHDTALLYFEKKKKKLLVIVNMTKGDSLHLRLLVNIRDSGGPQGAGSSELYLKQNWKLFISSKLLIKMTTQFLMFNEVNTGSYNISLGNTRIF